MSAEEGDLFCLQDSRTLVGGNLMWWSVAGSYTSDIDKAKTFSRDDAISQHISRNTDVPWPIAYIESKTHRVVDMQYIKQRDRLFVGDGYIQVIGRYSGNDLVWLAEAGVTCDLGQAKVFALPSNKEGGLGWPKSYIDEKSRRVVGASGVSIKIALAGTGVVLFKPKKERKPRAK